MSNLELGQVCWGNKWEALDCPKFVIHDLLNLAETTKAGEWWFDDAVGDYENDVFEIHPYYWGDCECGHEVEAEAWSEAHPHAPDCYQSELERRYLAAGATNELYAGDGLPFDAESAIMEELAKEWGLPSQGCGVHCTCDHELKWREWASANQHAETCRTVIPNFRHKPSGLAVHWYKHIGRSTTINREVGRKKWRGIFRECKDSVQRSN